MASSFGVPFPIPFAAVVNQVATVNIGGTAPAEPVWTLTGPFSAPLQLSLVNGPSLTLNYAAVVGETVTIDTRRGQQSIRSSVAGNIFSFLTQPSQLFAIPPGVQQLQVAIDGTTDQSGAAMVYSARWHYL